MPPPNPATDPGDFALAIVQLANLVTRRLAPLFEDERLTPQQWAVISLLGRSEDPMSLAEIARAMLVSKQNMTGMIARLEQLGVIAREGDPNDLRSSQVQLTRRGRNVVGRLAPRYEEWLNVLQQELSAADHRTLNSAMATLIGKLQSGE